MSSEVSKARKKAVPQSDLDYLRELAEIPVREIAVGMTHYQVRDVVIHRDGLGRTLGSTEHIHEEKLYNIDGHWAE